MPLPETTNDAAIVRRVLAGDREAFRLLVERHQSRVYHRVLSVVRDPEEAEDLAQEAFVRAYTRLADYDPRWAFSTWLQTIATRLALNATRAARVRRTQAIEDLPPAAEPRSAAPDARDRAAGREWLDRLRDEVAALSEKARVIFGLRHEDELSIEEIARATGSSVSAVKVTLHRARRRLRDRLREYSDFA